MDRSCFGHNRSKLCRKLKQRWFHCYDLEVLACLTLTMCTYHRRQPPFKNGVCHMLRMCVGLYMWPVKEIRDHVKGCQRAAETLCDPTVNLYCEVCELFKRVTINVKVIKNPQSLLHTLPILTLSCRNHLTFLACTHLDNTWITYRDTVLNWSPPVMYTSCSQMILSSSLIQTQSGLLQDPICLSLILINVIQLAVFNQSPFDKYSVDIFIYTHAGVKLDCVLAGSGPKRMFGP